MRRAVRADLDAAGMKGSDLVRREERVSRRLVVPVVHAAEPVRDDEDGRLEPAAEESRQRAVEHASVAVVEREDGPAGPGRRCLEKLVERDDPIAAAEEGVELPAEVLLRHAPFVQRRARAVCSDLVVHQDRRAGALPSPPVEAQ